MKISRARKAAAILALAVLCLAGSRAGSGDKPGSRFIDLVSTGLRNSLIDLSMDLFPKPMVDPAIDEDGEVFSYFVRPSFQIGLRGEPQATQVTDNGHLWTGAAEWLVLIGDEPEPLNQRIYTLYKGYLPCIEYTTTRGGVAYTVRAFQYWLSEPHKSVPVNFIKVTAKNVSDDPARAAFSAAFMYGPRDHRCQQMRQMNFNPLWRYEMTDRAALRDGKIIYAWRDRPNAVMRKPGKTYQGPWTGAGRTEPVALAEYGRELAHGESMSASFAMPHYPAAASLESELADADFDDELGRMEAYWEGWLSRGAHFQVSEKKVADASRAYIIHALMSQNIISDDEVEQHVNRFQYNRFWLRDSSFFVSLYDQWGYTKVARSLCRHFYGYQKEDGNFLSQHGQLDGWGQSMWALGSHVRYSADRDFAEESLPYMERAVAWLDDTLAHDSWGLMPPTDAFDNESIQGRYTGHNFWALTGLDSAIYVCGFLDRPDEAEKYRRLRDAYYDRFMKILRETAAERDGVIPPGLDVPGGTDWGNLLPVYPGHIMDANDPLVTSTFEHYREQRMQEGIGMWQKSLHHYLTERVAQTALIRGEQEPAIDDLYGMLLHTGACHEGFEWAVFAWDGRDYCLDMPWGQTCNFTPHGWYAAAFDLLLRNMLIREEGNVLHLASALSPAWTRPGDRVAAENAPTWFGTVSYVLEMSDSKAVLSFTPSFRRTPEKILFHVPYYLSLTSASADGQPLAIDGSAIVIPARACKVTIEFERKPVPEKSYESKVLWYRNEYKKRYEQKRR